MKGKSGGGGIYRNHDKAELVCGVVFCIGVAAIVTYIVISTWR